MQDGARDARLKKERSPDSRRDADDRCFTATEGSTLPPERTPPRSELHSCSHNSSSQKESSIDNSAHSAEIADRFSDAHTTPPSVFRTQKNSAMSMPKNRFTT